MVNKASVSAVAVIAALAIASPVLAAPYTVVVAPVTLDTLIPSGSITVGDKVFTGFSYDPTGTGMPTAANVKVEGITETIDGIDTEGLRFIGNFGAQPGNNSDVLIGYTVTVNDPQSFLISDAHLLGDPAVFTNQTGSITVTETWTPNIGNAENFIGALNSLSPVLKAKVDFSTHVASLTALKDIAATGGTGSVQLSFVDQTYSQTSTGGNPPPRLPEPASLSLLAIAGTGLLARRNRR